MNYLKFYVFGAVIIGFLQTIDGILLVLDNGFLRDFNMGVSMLEFLWIPICISTLVVFKRQETSILSPLSYIIYHVIGSIIATTTAAPKEGQPLTIPLGFAVAGLVFGIYYTYINYRMIKNNA